MALRLLDSIEVADQESVDEASSTEIASRVDDILADRVETIPAEQVFADLAQRRATRDR